jgi:hypothetical protein
MRALAKVQRALGQDAEAAQTQAEAEALGRAR